MDAGSPNSRMLPPLGLSRPSMRRMSVVLPAPLAPSRPRISPRRTLRLTASTAVNWPKRLVTCRASARDAIVLPPLLAGERGRNHGVFEVRLHWPDTVREPPVRGPYPPASTAPPGQRRRARSAGGAPERSRDVLQDLCRS